MRIILSMLIFLISVNTFSQIRATIIDRETKKTVPYVNIWVENKNIGTTSNDKGEFILNVDNSQNIVFSAIGFATKSIISDSIQKLVELQPQITELNEVVIKSKKQTQELIIGKFKKSKINHYFACGITPWITARFFNYAIDYNKTPFLKKIRINTLSEVRDAKFNIRFYDVNDKGEPENYIHDENIFGIARKGNKITEIDLSELDIQFPEKGFFIAIEWLIIENNKHEYSFTIKGTKKKHEGISYEPSLGTIPSETNENSWIFNQGKWKKIWKNRRSIRRNKDKYSLLAIELTLTN